MNAGSVSKGVSTGKGVKGCKCMGASAVAMLRFDIIEKLRLFWSGMIITEQKRNKQ